jgi:hypothetical protein
MENLESTAFNIGYNSSRDGRSCIPSMNAELQALMAPFPNCHGTRMAIMTAFRSGVNRHTDEILSELM